MDGRLEELERLLDIRFPLLQRSGSSFKSLNSSLTSSRVVDGRMSVLWPSNDERKALTLCDKLRSMPSSGYFCPGILDCVFVFLLLEMLENNRGLSGVILLFLLGNLLRLLHDVNLIRAFLVSQAGIAAILVRVLFWIGEHLSKPLSTKVEIGLGFSTDLGPFDLTSLGKLMGCV